jgi:UDP-glucose 4-epimerase
MSTTTNPVSLVTGGAGFIGAHVVRELLLMKHQVIVLDDLSGGFEENLPEGITFIHGSILDEKLIEQIFTRYQFDYVYHLAAYAAEGLSHFIRRFNYQNNLIGSINLINASVLFGVKKFVFTSSIAVYGRAQLPMCEDIQPLPEDPYGIAKLAVEQDLKAAHEMFGLDYVIFRPHNVFGEYQNLGDKYRNVVGIFMNQLMQDQSLSIFGDGSQTRAFSYIGDVAPFIARCIDTNEATNHTFNIGADQEYTVKELASEVCSVMQKEGKLLFLPARNEVMHAYADHSKAHKVFGKSATTTLRDGLMKMATWAKQTGIKKSETFKHIEIQKNLPGFWTE